MGAYRPLKQAIGQCSNLEERHHQIGEALFLTVVLNGDDIGMPQIGEHLGLEAKALLEIGIFREMRSDDFDGYETVAFPIVGAIDRGHAAAANLLQDLIALEALPL